MRILSRSGPTCACAAQALSTNLRGQASAVRPGRRIRLRPILRDHEHIAIDDLRLGDRHVSIEAVARHVDVDGDLDDFELCVDQP